MVKVMSVSHHEPDADCENHGLIAKGGRDSGLWRRLAAALVLIGLPAAPGLAAPKPVEAVFVGVQGDRYDLNGAGGTWTLVNYFATWCASCVEEIPTLTRLLGDGARLHVVGITDEGLSPEAFRAFSAAHPAAYPRMDVLAGSMPRDLPGKVLGLRLRPITYLIRPDGVVAKRFVGALDPSDIAFVAAAVR